MNEEYKKVLKDIKERKLAIAAFNVVNTVTTEAVIKAAEELQMPVITQISTSVVKKLGIDTVLFMLNNAKKNAKVPVITHLDHCPDLQFTKECIAAGFQSVMFDGSHLSLKENIEKTKEVVEFARTHGCHVEGEVGVISGVEDGVGSEYGVLASLEDTLYYIKKTGVDTIAPAVGTAHGLYKGVPKINYELLEGLAKATDVPVVIHGGTGLTEDTFKKLVNLGASKINISTALKYAYIDSIKKVAAKNNLPVNPLSIDGLITEELSKEMKKYIKMFT